ncbi:hypothetical protein HanHA300_Chr15g0550011 [Helianthus annuus]|nr:hypothetical protein HanHA300_Chr15g0550011 [Helianthus annuus]KAJ0651093.1 hypothetical protein HanOQP8_Chr15g0557281 [Helianthus annuus]KAJ0829672.1 hypothetical protein HanPSC8_Chr15g0646451 [Helianthus annuus]
MSLEITESARGEVSDQTSEQQTVEGQGGQPVVVPVVPAVGTTGTQSKWTVWCEKIHHILKNRRRVRRPAAPAPPTGPESVVITLPPESSSVAVTLSMEPSFKASYKEEVKAVKIAWGATLVLLNVIRLEKTLAPLIYTSVGLLWLSIVCWLVIDQVYKQAKDDPKEDWLWSGWLVLFGFGIIVYCIFILPQIYIVWKVCDIYAWKI